MYIKYVTRKYMCTSVYVHISWKWWHTPLAIERLRQKNNKFAMVSEETSTLWGILGSGMKPYH